MSDRNRGGRNRDGRGHGGRKPGDKKPGDRIPVGRPLDDKKPDDKKPGFRPLDDKKPDDKKPGLRPLDDKKPDDKKPGLRPLDDKKPDDKIPGVRTPDFRRRPDKNSPQELIEKLSDDFPFLLMPVKIETKFKTVDEKKELWVRIFPDEIAIHTHEELLTEKEYYDGKNYWTNIFDEADVEVKQSFWTSIVSARGANRSAWIIKQTKPVNWDENPPNEKALKFPEPDMFKESS